MPSELFLLLSVGITLSALAIAADFTTEPVCCRDRPLLTDGGGDICTLQYTCTRPPNLNYSETGSRSPPGLRGGEG